jgi:hypothetical protein
MQKSFLLSFRKRGIFFGNDHPYIRWTMEELANLYQRMGKHQAAEELERFIEDQEV